MTDETIEVLARELGYSNTVYVAFHGDAISPKPLEG